MVILRQPLTEPKPSYAHGRQIAQHIFMATMALVDVRRAMLSKLQFGGSELRAGGLAIPVAKPPRVLAIGKAAVRMAAALDEILGGRVEAGVVVAPVEPGRKLEQYRYFVGGHPYPSQGSLESAEAALDLVSGLTRDDLVIFLISGGGSALFEKPLDPAVTLAALVEFSRLLVTGRLPIEQINVLRKHISAVKGGRLAAAASPARQLTLYLSDVPEAFPSMIASGPSMPDESTCEQCYEIAEQTGLTPKLPAAIRQRFVDRSLEETPKPGDGRFARSNYVCLLSSRDVVEAAVSIAGSAGFHAEIERGPWDADCDLVIKSSLASLDQCAGAHPGRAVCLVMGGEVTCEVTGRGIGGRNLSFALGAARLIEGRERVVLSAATDGRDGNSPSCGGVADGRTVSRSRALGMDAARFLAESDGYHFFRTLGDTIETGFTDNNLRDLRLLMSFE